MVRRALRGTLSAAAQRRKRMCVADRQTRMRADHGAPDILDVPTAHDVRDIAHVGRPPHFAINTPDVGHVPCVLPSVTSDAALGNCAVAFVFTAIHASVK